jgi:hypothetical protein
MLELLPSPARITTRLPAVNGRRVGAEVADEAAVGATDDDTDAATELVMLADAPSVMVMVGEEVEEGVADAASVLLDDGVTRPGVEVGVAEPVGVGAPVAEGGGVLEGVAPVESDAVALGEVLGAKQRAASTVVVADGTSCRHQIHDGAEVNAIHTARLLAQALTP